MNHRTLLSGRQPSAWVIYKWANTRKNLEKKTFWGRIWEELSKEHVYSSKGSSPLLSFGLSTDPGGFWKLYMLWIEAGLVFLIDQWTLSFLCGKENPHTLLLLTLLPCINWPQGREACGRHSLILSLPRQPSFGCFAYGCGFTWPEKQAGSSGAKLLHMCWVANLSNKEK